MEELGKEKIIRGFTSIVHATVTASTYANLSAVTPPIGGGVQVHMRMYARDIESCEVMKNG